MIKKIKSIWPFILLILVLTVREAALLFGGIIVGICVLGVIWAHWMAIKEWWRGEAGGPPPEDSWRE